MTDFDLIIVGGGPAGTAAALEAASEGLSVAIVDKDKFPREKCCGDGLTTSALAHLHDLGLDLSSLPSFLPTTSIELRSPKGRHHHYELSPPGHAAVVRRFELDAALVDLARSAGVTVLEQHPIEAVEAGPLDVVIKAGGLSMSTSFLIAADGMWSPTRRLVEGARKQRYLGEWHAFRQYFRGAPSTSLNRMAVWFEPDLLPGYAWAFPLADGSLNVGFGIRRGNNMSTQAMKRIWPELLQRQHIVDMLGPESEPEAPHRAWPIPAQLGRRSLTRGRVFFVGDAAASTDPMTGEGIGQALETGRLAAHAITTSRSASEASACYRRSITKGMVRDHRLAAGLSRLLANQTVTESALALTSSTAWSSHHFALWLFEAYPRATVFNPYRWHDKVRL